MRARNYIIAGTPRTGSSLLCEGLEATGIAGRPAEVFAPDFRSPWFNSWELPRTAPFSDYFAAAIQHGTGPNGIYGVKIQYMHVPVLAANSGYQGDYDDVLDWLFPEAKFINIIRRDRRAQALSFFRALQTNEWFRTDEVAVNAQEPKLDRDAVLALEADIAWQQNSWQRYFRKREIEPLVVEYDILAQNYRGEVARVLSFLDLDPAVARCIPPPRLIRQADEVTSGWRRLIDRRPDILDVSDVIADHPWLRRSKPFDHVVAWDVFRPEFYEALAGQMQEIIDRGLSDTPDGSRFSRNIVGYDSYGIGFSRDQSGPLGLFLSEGWRDLVNDLFGVGSTPFIFAGAHHHAVGSQNGFIHCDFNPVWFPRAADEGMQIPNDELCAYKTGRGCLAASEKLQVVRGVAVIFYLLNDGWHRGDGGETGLFDTALSALERPAARVRPENNSLIAFECTPNSLHSFLRNHRLPRTSIIMWTHRPYEEAVAKFGADNLEYWK